MSSITTENGKNGIIVHAGNYEDMEIYLNVVLSTQINPFVHFKHLYDMSGWVIEISPLICDVKCKPKKYTLNIVIDKNKNTGIYTVKVSDVMYQLEIAIAKYIDLNMYSATPKRFYIRQTHEIEGSTITTITTEEKL